MEITFEAVNDRNEAILQSVFEHSPEYFRKVEGSEVLPHFARKELESVPKKQSPTYEKIYLLVYLNNDAIGAIEFHKDHPSAGQTYIGLLLLDERFHGRGVGRKVYEAAENYAKHKLSAHALGLGVSENNDVKGFWVKMGFKMNGKTYTWKGEKIESLVHEMEKSI